MAINRPARADMEAGEDQTALRRQLPSDAPIIVQRRSYMICIVYDLLYSMIHPVYDKV